MNGTPPPVTTRPGAPAGHGPFARFQAYVATPTGKKTVMGLGAVGAVVAGLWVRARNKATGDATPSGTTTAASLVPSTGTYAGGGGTTGGGISGEAISDSINALGSNLAQSLGDTLAAANATQTAASAQQQSVLDAIAAQLTALQTAQTSTISRVSPAKSSLGTPVSPAGTVVTGTPTSQADVDAFLRSMATAVTAKVGANATQAQKDAAARQILADAQTKAAAPAQTGTLALWNKPGAAARKPA